MRQLDIGLCSKSVDWESVLDSVVFFKLVIILVAFCVTVVLCSLICVSEALVLNVNCHFHVA